MSAFIETIRQLLSNVRFADVLDIGVIAILLYFFLSWCRERASRSLPIGLSLIAAVYLGARWLEMYLTTMLFQVGITVLLFVLAVVFQQDLRRAFDRIASSRWLRLSTKSRPESGELDVVVETVTALAEQHTGALIVFKGREPLDRHIRSGVPVGGQISFPLLCSIFHAQSPGHDGAVIIDEGRIEALGTHLPLSKDFAKTRGGGTRHAAALGLAECCDALVILVSEEKGTICVAERGELTEIAPGEVMPRLTQFLEDRLPRGRPQAGQRSLTRRLGLKCLSLALACGLWFMFAYRVDPVQRTVLVPIEYRNLPQDLMIDAPWPTEAEVTLSGSERAFDLLASKSLAISFNLQNAKADSNYFVPTEDHLRNLPEELEITEISPAEIEMRVRKKVPTQPVEREPQGELDPGDDIK